MAGAPSSASMSGSSVVPGLPNMYSTPSLAKNLEQDVCSSPRILPLGLDEYPVHLTNILFICLSLIESNLRPDPGNRGSNCPK